MGRHKIERMVKQPPRFCRFKPAGYNNHNKSIGLTLDEYEAIRLSDYEGKDQTTSAEIMNISRPTFTRLIESARQKVASMLLNGYELIIEGGNIHFRENLYECNDCHRVFQSSMTREIENCPECNSTNINNYAKGYGHGRCCRRRHRNGHK